MEIELGFGVSIKPATIKERDLEYSDYVILNKGDNNGCTISY